MNREQPLLLSCRLLERWGIDSLPFDPLAAAALEGIRIVPVSSEQGNEYPSLLRGEAALLAEATPPVILLGNQPTLQRRRWSIAHELAHFLIGAGEQRADELAGLLLCPPVVLHLCAVRSPREISRLCEVSAQAASIAFERVRSRRLTGDFLQTAQERRCAERFLPFISRILSAAAQPTHRIDL